MRLTRRSGQKGTRVSITGRILPFLLQFKGHKGILQIGNTQGGGMMRPHAAVAKRDPG